MTTRNSAVKQSDESVSKEIEIPKTKRERLPPRRTPPWLAGQEENSIHVDVVSPITPDDDRGQCTVM